MHLGIMGLPIRAVAGDRIKIIFYNMASVSHLMHPHGVHYNSLSEGAMYDNGNTNFKKPVSDICVFINIMFFCDNYWSNQSSICIFLFINM